MTKNKNEKVGTASVHIKGAGVGDHRDDWWDQVVAKSISLKNDPSPNSRTTLKFERIYETDAGVERSYITAYLGPQDRLVIVEIDT